MFYVTCVYTYMYYHSYTQRAPVRNEAPARKAERKYNPKSVSIG